MVSSILRAFWQDEEGQDLVEYALLLAFIALAAVSVLGGVKTSISTIFTGVSTNLATAAS